MTIIDLLKFFKLADFFQLTKPIIEEIKQHIFFVVNMLKILFLLDYTTISFYNINMERFHKLVEYVKTTCWLDNTDINIIIEQAHKVFNEITVNKTKKKKLYRLCGQTGSGKTSQLLATIEKLTDEQNLNPVVLGVRTCAEFHPNFEEFKKQFPSGELREKTNGFALKCMSYVLKLLIENDYMVLLDITLLDPIFEEFILSHLKENSYDIEYHILAVNKQISDRFIEKRLKETGRVIYKSSADYFYKILPIGLKYLCENDNVNTCYVWTAFDLEPVYFGKISDCFDKFIKAQSEIKELSYSEEELKNAKFLALKKTY